MSNPEVRNAEGRQFTAAAGRFGFSALYDPALGLLTRERRWRALLLGRLDPQAGDVILDVGCGTGSLAILIKQRSPQTRVIGVDPDPTSLRRAADKAAQAGCEVEWHRGFAGEADQVAGAAVTKVVSSLVFHQVPAAEKRAGVAAMFRVVGPGGRVHIADYAAQRGLMRHAFRFVQLLDGVSDTQPNADGMLERLLAEQTGRPVEPHAVVPTATGAISLFETRVANV